MKEKATVEEQKIGTTGFFDIYAFNSIQKYTNNVWVVSLTKMNDKKKHHNADSGGHLNETGDEANDVNGVNLLGNMNKLKKKYSIKNNEGNIAKNVGNITKFCQDELKYSCDERPMSLETIPKHKKHSVNESNNKKSSQTEKMMCDVSDTEKIKKKRHNKRGMILEQENSLHNADNCNGSLNDLPKKKRKNKDMANNDSDDQTSTNKPKKLKMKIVLDQNDQNGDTIMEGSKTTKPTVNNESKSEQSGAYQDYNSHKIDADSMHFKEPTNKKKRKNSSRKDKENNPNIKEETCVEKNRVDESHTRDKEENADIDVASSKRIKKSKTTKNKERTHGESEAEQEYPSGQSTVSFDDRFMDSNTCETEKVTKKKKKKNKTTEDKEREHEEDEEKQEHHSQHFIDSTTCETEEVKKKKKKKNKNTKDKEREHEEDKEKQEHYAQQITVSLDGTFIDSTTCETEKAKKKKKKKNSCSEGNESNPNIKVKMGLQSYIADGLGTSDRGETMIKKEKNQPKQTENASHHLIEVENGSIDHKKKKDVGEEAVIDEPNAVDEVETPRKKKKRKREEHAEGNIHCVDQNNVTLKLVSPKKERKSSEHEKVKNTTKSPKKNNSSDQTHGVLDVPNTVACEGSKNICDFLKIEISEDQNHENLQIGSPKRVDQQTTGKSGVNNSPLKYAQCLPSDLSNGEESCSGHVKSPSQKCLKLEKSGIFDLYIRESDILETSDTNEGTSVADCGFDAFIKHRPNGKHQNVRRHARALDEHEGTQNRKKPNRSPKLTGKSIDELYEEAMSSELSVEAETLMKNLTVLLPWPIAPLHCIESRICRNPTEEQKEQIKVLGLEVKCGAFSAAEDETIERNWKTFCSTHNVPDDPTPFFSSFFSYKAAIAERIRFVQFLAHDLNNRLLFTVFKRFKRLYSQKTSQTGRYSAEEDETIIKYLTTTKSQTYYADLAKMLNRDKKSIEHRCSVLIRKPEKVKWDLEKIEKLVAELMDVTNINDIKELEHREISGQEWKMVAERFDMDYRKIRRAWITTAHPRLFIPHSIHTRTIKFRLVKLLMENNNTDWRTIQWNELAHEFPGMTGLKLESIFKHLVEYHVPEKFQNNLKECLTYLNDEVFPWREIGGRKIKRISVQSDEPDNEHDLDS